MPLDSIKTREDFESLPLSWFTSIEKAKTKAKALIKKLAAIERSDMLIVGKVTSVGDDTLWNLKYPYCKIMLEDVMKFKKTGEFIKKSNTSEIAFINKPEMVLSLDEVKKIYPEAYAEIHVKIKTENL